MGYDSTYCTELLWGMCELIRAVGCAWRGTA